MLVAISNLNCSFSFLTQLIFSVANGLGRKLVPALPSPVRMIILKVMITLRYLLTPGAEGPHRLMVTDRHTCKKVLLGK